MPKTFSKKVNSSRNWCFTHYEDEKQELNDEIECVYLILGKEVCPTTKRKHLQGFVHFKNALTWKGAQKRLCNYKMHVEIMKGTHDEAIEYCMKDGDYIEFGERPEQGKRNDYTKMLELEAEGLAMSELIDNCTSYQSARSAEIIRKYKGAKRKVQEIKSIWIYNGTSRKRKQVAWGHDPNAYVPVSPKWWDGYDGQKTVIIDEINDEWVKQLDKLTDNFPFRKETKGGSVEVQYTTIIFTGDYNPSMLKIPSEIIKRIEFQNIRDTEVGLGNTNQPETEVNCNCSCDGDDEFEIDEWMP